MFVSTLIAQVRRNEIKQARLIRVFNLKEIDNECCFFQSLSQGCVSYIHWSNKFSKRGSKRLCYRYLPIVPTWHIWDKKMFCLKRKHNWNEFLGGWGPEIYTCREFFLRWNFFFFFFFFGDGSIFRINFLLIWLDILYIQVSCTKRSLIAVEECCLILL